VRLNEVTAALGMGHSVTIRVEDADSESSRNSVHLYPGTPFTFARNTQ
jgi:hypothetical protein